MLQFCFMAKENVTPVPTGALNHQLSTQEIQVVIHS
jgi:hypothetical protein